MSTYLQTSHPSANTHIQDGSVLSATGLSRASLRELFRRGGLFGADSDLRPDEQAVVGRVLGHSKAAGHPAFEAVRPERKHRLEVLTRVAELAVRGGGNVDHAEWDRARASGVDSRVLSEIERVVGIVRDVYGLPAPALSSEVSLTTVTDPIPLRRAA